MSEKSDWIRLAIREWLSQPGTDYRLLEAILGKHAPPTLDDLAAMAKRMISGQGIEIYMTCERDYVYRANDRSNQRHPDETLTAAVLRLIEEAKKGA